MSGNGRSSSDLAHIARAVTVGAVDTLLFDIDGAVYGSVDEQTGAIQIEDEASGLSYDIVDEVMGRAILFGGRVVGVRQADLPDRNSPVAALLRYPM